MTSRPYKQGIDRFEFGQVPSRPEDWIDGDNPVRAIDAYVDTLDLAALGFDLTEPNRTAAGQPAYPPAGLLKLYLYGYINRLRSSRVLERECRRNLEVIWLEQGFQFSHQTIANFRKRNAKALRRVHADFIALCKELKLLGGKRVGVDGSHFNGNVSDKSFRSLKSLARDIDKLEQQAAKWLEDMDAADREDIGTPSRDPGLPAKLEKLKALQALKKAKEAELKALEESGETQRSATDPDARQLNKRGQKTAGYNVQIVVDDLHKLIVADEVVQDGNDLNQLHPMLSQAKIAMGVDGMEGSGDKGYFNIAQIAACERDGITVYVPEPGKGGRQRQEGRFVQGDFTYEPETDTYRCPDGRALHKSGEPRLKGGSLVQRYACSEAHCRECPLKGRCITAKSDRREIHRNGHEAVLERHRKRMEANPGHSRKRSALVEHPFGTLKCRAGWNHFLVRGLTKVRGEWSLMALAYNFTRVLNILGLQAFRDYCAQNAACCA
ncbi:MAG: IS1182 family transposase [bacterium]